MSGRKEDKHENRTEHNPHISGAAGISPEADPARSEKAGQVSKVADQGSGCIAGAEYGPVGDHLYLAGWADLRGGEDDAGRDEKTKRTDSAVGRISKKQLPSACRNHSD